MCGRNCLFICPTVEIELAQLALSHRVLHRHVIFSFVRNPGYSQIHYLGILCKKQIYSYFINGKMLCCIRSHWLNRFE